MAPEYPAINFGIKSISELKRAYCVAVNFIEVKPDKYITNAAPAKPLVAWAIESKSIESANLTFLV